MPQIAYFEPVGYRVRGFRAGELVVDSHRVHLQRGEGDNVPVFAFPRGDVRADALPDDAVHDATRDGFVTVDWLP